MILKKIALLATIVMVTFGMAACQEKTASQEAHEEMKDVVENFTDDIEDVTDDLGGKVEEAGDQVEQKFDEQS